MEEQSSDHLARFNASQEALITLALESWRFTKVFERAIVKLDPTEISRFLSQYRWFLKKMEEALEKSNIRIVNIEGQLFDPGMAATALNIDEFEPGTLLVVDQMLEPILMGESGLIKTGVVTLKKKEQ